MQKWNVFFHLQQEQVVELVRFPKVSFWRLWVERSRNTWKQPEMPRMSPSYSFVPAISEGCTLRIPDCAKVVQPVFPASIPRLACHRVPSSPAKVNHVCSIQKCSVNKMMSKYALRNTLNKKQGWLLCKALSFSERCAWKAGDPTRQDEGFVS